MEEMEMKLKSDMSQYAFAMITALSLSLLVPSSALMSTTAYAQNQISWVIWFLFKLSMVINLVRTSAPVRLVGKV